MLNKPYEEIISEYTLDDLLSVKKRIDADANPDRYELVLQEIAKRENGIGPKVDVKEVLDKSYDDPKSKRLNDVSSYIISAVFGLTFLISLFYRDEIEKLYGPAAVMYTYILLVLNIYFGYRAWHK